MIIKEMHSETNAKYATVELDYDEIKNIANGLVELDRINPNRGYDFLKLHRDMAFLFDIVKNATIDSTLLRILDKIQQRMNEAKQEK